MVYSIQNFKLEIDKMKPLFWKNGNEAMKQPNRVHAISE